MPLSQNVFLTIIVVFMCFISLTALFMVCFDYYKFRLINKNDVERQHQLLIQEQEENQYL